MKGGPYRPYQSEPRWFPVVRQILGLLIVASIAVTVAALSMTWALEREHGAVVIAPDSAGGPLFPVCEGSPVLWFPARRLRRMP